MIFLSAHWFLLLWYGTITSYYKSEYLSFSDSVNLLTSFVYWTGKKTSLRNRGRLEHIRMPRKQAPQQSYAPPLPQSHTLVQLGAPQGSNNFLCKDALGGERLVEISKSLKRMKGLIVMRGISSFLRKAGAWRWQYLQNYFEGDYAIIKLFPTAPEENVRLVGEIVYILEKGDVKEWKRAGQWWVVLSWLHWKNWRICHHGR